MADVKVRKLNYWVVETIRKRAEQAGHSLEEELRRILTEAALKAQHDFASHSAAWRRIMQKKHGTFSDSTALIREDREARG